MGGDPKLARLVSSEAEIRSCARLFGAGRAAVFTGFEALLPRLEAAAGYSYKYWHLSSHVVADAERPERSYIALSAPRRGGAIRKLTMADVVDLPVRAEMVLLNGCESGGGKNLPGEGLVGLARAFLAAGAASVCATRWKIPDDGGSLVAGLYRRLTAAGGHADRAAALRAAQVEMIRAGDWRSEPRYWAAYLLIGSYRARPGEPDAE
jgi:CHAT domain-containing protein